MLLVAVLVNVLLATLLLPVEGLAASPPTASVTPTASATPTATPTGTPAAAAAGATPAGTTLIPLTPQPTTEPPRGGRGVRAALALVTTVLLLGIVAAALVITGKEWFLKLLPRKAAGLPPPSPPEPEPPQDETRPPVATERPRPGIPYLQSLEHVPEAIYCPLARPAITVGRAPECDLVIDQHFKGWPTVSLRHATIERDGEDLVVIDSDSENGVYVNGQRTRENVLYEGCILSFGQARFVFKMNREESAA